TVEDLLRRIKPQAIKMKFFDPVACVRQEEFSDSCGIIAIKVDRIAPFVLISVGEVSFRKLLQVIAIRSEMVVDDVEHHSEAHTVRTINEGPKIVGGSV